MEHKEEGEKRKERKRKDKGTEKATDLNELPLRREIMDESEREGGVRDYISTEKVQGLRNERDR